MKKYIKTFENTADVDDKKFNWWQGAYTPSLLPYAVFYDNNYFKISNFDKSDNEYVVYEVESIEAIINLSTSLYKDISLSELSKIANIIYENNIDSNLVDIMVSERITDPVRFRLILSIDRFPYDIKAVLSQKKMPLKTVEQISKLNHTELDFLSEFFKANKNISYQDIKKFIDDLIVHRDYIKDKIYNKLFQFPKNISAKHIEVDNILKGLNKRLAPIKISVDDNYEAGEIKFEAVVRADFSYEDILMKLEDSKEELDRYFKLIKQYGLY